MATYGKKCIPVGFPHRHISLLEVNTYLVKPEKFRVGLVCSWMWEQLNAYW